MATSQLTLTCCHSSLRCSMCRGVARLQLLGASSLSDTVTEEGRGSRWPLPGLRNGNCHPALNSLPRSPLAGKLASETANALAHPALPTPAPSSCAQTDVRRVGQRDPRELGPDVQLPGLGPRRHASSEARRGPGTGESTPQMRWLIKVSGQTDASASRTGSGLGQVHSSPLLF